VAYLKRRNYVLGGVDLGTETVDNSGVETVDDVAGAVEPAVQNGAPMGGSFNLFGISVSPLYLIGGAVAGYFLGGKNDALRNAALGAAAGVGISYFTNRMM